MNTLKKIFFSIVHIIIFVCFIPIFQLLGLLASNTFSVNAIVDDISFSIIYISGVLILGNIYAKHIIKKCFRYSKKCSKFVFWKCFFAGITLPIIVTLFFLFFTDGFVEKNAYGGGWGVISDAVFVQGVAAAVCEEFIFRFLILHYLEAQWNTVSAIIIQSILFAILHIPSLSSLLNPDIILLLVSGTVVGIMFALIYAKTGSLWSSIIFHMLWNIIINGGIFIVEAPYYGYTVLYLYRYNLLSSNKLLTGGVWGIEASLPAIIGYLCMIFYLFISHKFCNIMKYKGRQKDTLLNENIY